MFNSEENGFSLIELIVVLIITAILAQLGFTAFNRYARRTRAFVAKTALKNIQRECESNRDLEAPEIFTVLPVKGYSIATRDTNSCYGQSSDGKVAAIADNQNEIPNYFYDFLLGEITCTFSGNNNIFESCSKNNINSSNTVVNSWDDLTCENNNLVVARYTMNRNGTSPTQNNMMRFGGRFSHSYQMPNQNQRTDGYSHHQDTWMIGIFEQEKYLKKSEVDQPDKKILKNKDELVDYVSKWFEPLVKPPDNAPFFEREMYNKSPKTAEDYVNQNMRIMKRDAGGEKFFCD